jgi:ATP-dependent RNA/DNA helicase IGHMBP2
MEYFDRLLELLKLEWESDKASYESITQSASANDRRAAGICWYPIAIRDTELGRGDYLTVEIERTTHHDLIHQFRSGVPARLFSNHNAENDRIEGTISWVSGSRLKINFPTDELPDWASDGKLGVDLLFDDNSYHEMRKALIQANQLSEKKEEGRLIRILTGDGQPEFFHVKSQDSSKELNASQEEAVDKILSARDIAVVHGPPGTGKTTVVVQAVKELILQEKKQVLVTAASNTAVDLLCERLSDKGLNVVRIGNPVRVSERLQSLTLDYRLAEHPMAKDIKKMKKRANEFRDMAHKYKRNFGKAEREQRKALFDEAKSIMRDVSKTEQYILDDLLDKADVIAATLVGTNHYNIQNRLYDTAIIDEAGQALEPACWIPVLKAKRLVLAGDHLQLPPTVKSAEAAAKGLEKTLMEKNVALHPEAVVLLKEQYRMHAHIMGFSSKIFYDNQLTAHHSVAAHEVFTGDLPLLFIDTAGCGFEEKQESGGTENREEAALLVKHFIAYTDDLQAAYKGVFPTVAIISPYKRQVELLKELLANSAVVKQHSDRISINTIDSFQGQERDVVYISMARSNPDGRIGFLSEIRRMNVAMTRARKKLVIIGDSATLSQFPFYAGLLEYAEGISAWESAWTFMDL